MIMGTYFTAQNIGRYVKNVSVVRLRTYLYMYSERRVVTSTYRIVIFLIARHQKLLGILLS